jgi:hypothetical protein
MVSMIIKIVVDKLAILCLEALMKGPNFGDMKIILTGHSSMMDKLSNTEYE